MMDDSTLLRHEDDIKTITQGMNQINITLAVLAAKMEEVLLFAKTFRDSGMENKVNDLIITVKELQREVEKQKDFQRENDYKQKNLTHFFTRWFPLLWILTSAMWAVFNFLMTHSH